MPSVSHEERMETYRPLARGSLERAGDALAARQEMGGLNRGNVPPWQGSGDTDFHGTLASIWVWSRAQKLLGTDRFSLHIAAGWSFIDLAWKEFVPRSLGASASDEAAFDCAMVLRAFIGEVLPASPANPDFERRERVAKAARLLGVYLTDLDVWSGREFRDPAFLAWTLADYARMTDERGLGAIARRFVDVAFRMNTPPSFVHEPVESVGLFDFSCTTGTRILATIAAEGMTPFVGAWLRERVLPIIPNGFVNRPSDENIWNACAAVSLGHAFNASTEPQFLAAYSAVMEELELRVENGALGRSSGFPAETLATFYYAMAAHAILD
jgi:hypothetical protein